MSTVTSRQPPSAASSFQASAAGSAETLSAGAEGGGEQGKGARRKRRRRRDAAASVSNDLSALDHLRPPFYGFTQEYVEAQKILGREAIRRIGVFIKLLRCKDTDDRQRKIIMSLCKATRLLID